MSEVPNRLQISSSLLRALDVITNLRAFLSLVIGFTVVTILTVLFSYIGMRMIANASVGTAVFMGGVGFLINLFIGLSTYSAAGLHAHRQLSGISPLSLGTGFIAGAATLPRLIGLVLLTCIGVVVVMLVLVLVYFVCKIPVLGHVLYFFALPAGTLVAGILALAVAFLVPLFGPAVWSGHTVLQSFAVLWGILKTRLLSVVINTLLLGLLVGVIFMLVFSAYFEGMFVNTSLSSISLGAAAQGMFSSLTSIFSSFGISASHMGYILAGDFGLLLLAVAVGALPALVLIAGDCQIFYTAADGLDTRVLESNLKDHMGNLQKVVEQAQEQTTAVAGAKCPHCGAPLEGDEMFCGNCGQRIDA